MYTPIRTKPAIAVNKITSLMGKSGVNLRDLPQLLDPKYALNINNYLPTTDGGLQRRKGLKKIIDASATSAITMVEAYKTYIMFAYDKYVKAYDTVAGTITTVKTYGGAVTVSGQRYGDYFFICGNSKIDYITESGGTFTVTQITDSPTSIKIQIIGPRLYATTANPGEVRYSNVDTGANPPFQDFTGSTAADDAGIISYRNAGTVNSIEGVNDNIVVLCDYGKYAFKINTVESGGTIIKKDDVIMSRLDMGGASGAVTTPYGLFYANESGLWQLVSVSPDMNSAQQEAVVSVLLGKDYFDDISLTNCDIAYDAKNNLILVTCAKDSSSNNLVIVYNPETKAFSTITGWNINRFYKDQSQTLYGGSSIASKVYQLFTGWSDDGTDVWYEFYQELKSGDLETKQELIGQYVQGILSPSSVINISFDIYDTKGVQIERKIEFNWRLNENSLDTDGYGEAAYGTSPYGGDVDFAGMVESFDGGRFKIANYQRLRVRFSGHDQVGHVINWLRLETRTKAQIRRRKLSLT